MRTHTLLNDYSLPFCYGPPSSVVNASLLSYDKWQPILMTTTLGIILFLKCLYTRLSSDQLSVADECVNHWGMALRH